MKAAKQLSAVAWDDWHVSFAKLLDNDGSYEVYPIADPRQTIAALQYTGGTTGLPKGAMLTHANLTSACQQAWEPPVVRRLFWSKGGALARHAAAIPHLCTYGQRSICCFRRVGDHSARTL